MIDVLSSSSSEAFLKFRSFVGSCKGRTTMTGCQNLQDFKQEPVKAPKWCEDEMQMLAHAKI